ncbi:MAG: hypothetical protein GXO75_12055, partial [Calditrichaeota bacterium]|nr:hypothetical protein [Calditrichota bacterium]
PLEDNKGNDTIIRFSRKNKEQYVMTEVDGKATGWTAHYIDKNWVVSEAPKKTVKKKAAKKKAAKKKTAKKKVAKSK